MNHKEEGSEWKAKKMKIILGLILRGLNEEPICGKQLNLYVTILGALCFLIATACISTPKC